MGEQVFFEARQIDVGIFKALSGVQGRQGDGVGVFVFVFAIGDIEQGQGRHYIGGGAGFLGLIDALDPFRELREVVAFALGVGRGFGNLFQPIVIADIREQLREGHGRRALGVQPLKVVQPVDESARALQGQGRHARSKLSVERGLGERAAAERRDLGQHLDRRRPDRAARRIDDAQQSVVVTRIGQQSQIADAVLDFAKVKKRAPPGHHIGNGALAEGVLEQACLVITTHQYREIGIAQAVHQAAMQDVVGQPLHFIVFAGAAHDADLVAEAVLAPQGFGIDVRVVGDQGVSGLQDNAAAAIVLLELDDFQARKVAG